jgi:hypothetical protein
MPPLAAAARFSQSPLKKARSPKNEPMFQPLTFVHAAGQELVDLLVALLHALQDGGLLFGREILEVEGLAGPDADPRESGPDGLVFGDGGTNCSAASR